MINKILNKRALMILGLLAVSLGASLLVWSGPKDGEEEEMVVPVFGDVLSLSYTIDGEVFTMKNGLAAKSLAVESSFMPTVRVFGAPVYGDLDQDGDEDAALWLEYQPGGSGTFYYAALALKEGDTYNPTSVMFLGDRIAPQTLNIEAGRAVYNFAERKAGEPFSVAPSVGRSVYVHLDKASGELGEWVKDFEGESDYTERYSGQVDRVKVVFEHFNFTSYRLITNGQVRSGELNTERGYKDDEDATVFVLNWQEVEANQLRYVRLTAEPGKLFLLNSAGELVVGSVLVLEE